MWEAFLDADFPVGLHVGGRRPGTPVASIYESAPRFMTGLVMSKLTMAESVSELIHGLVMQRYPELKFIAVEGQIGWISFFQYYSDHLWEKHRFWTKSELEEPPSYYFRRQVFATFMEDPVGLRERHHIGIDNIMWASDYPHSETTWPNSKALTDEWFTPFGEDDKAQDPLGERRQALPPRMSRPELASAPKHWELRAATRAVGRPGVSAGETSPTRSSRRDGRWSRRTASSTSPSSRSSGEPVSR